MPVLSKEVPGGGRTVLWAFPNYQRTDSLIVLLLCAVMPLQTGCRDTVARLGREMATLDCEKGEGRACRALSLSVRQALIHGRGRLTKEQRKGKKVK